jgi:hypothetical protein
MSTYIEANGESKNTLDLILANQESRVNSIKMHSPLGTANKSHHMIKLSIDA